jgi:hypothetical protein
MISISLKSFLLQRQLREAYLQNLILALNNFICRTNNSICRKGKAKKVVHGPTGICGLQTQVTGVLQRYGGCLTMDLMVQCGAPLLWYHPLITTMVNRVIKLLALIKESRQHLLFQRIQLRLNVRRERWLKLLRGHSQKQVQQLLSVILIRLASKILPHRLCNFRLPTGLSILPGSLGRLSFIKLPWIDFVEA